MRSATFLRIASLLTLLHAVLHTVGGVFGKVPPGPATVAANAMKQNAFLAFGLTRTFWEFYRGMGLAVSIALTLDAVVMWLLADLAKRSTPHLRGIIAAFLVAYVVLAVNSQLYFFLPPVIVELLIAASLAMAIITMRPNASPNA